MGKNEEGGRKGMRAGIPKRWRRREEEF